MARKRRSQSEIFLDHLLEFAGSEDTPVSNLSFRGYLDWNEDKYSKMKSELVSKGLLIAGRGHGGTIRLPKSPINASRIFVSYSHQDKKVKQELLKHLMPLKRLKLVETWTDLEIKAGDEWDKEISSNLESADIVILLISIDFLNSKYCYDVELQQALSLHEQGKMRIIPVIVRPCLWQHSPFAKFQALPKDAKAVASWENLDTALTNVAEGILKVAKDLKASREQ